MNRATFNDVPGEAIEVFTVDRLRRTYSLGRQAIYSAMRSGDLPAIKLGQRTLIRRADVDAWLSRQPAFTPEV